MEKLPKTQMKPVTDRKPYEKPAIIHELELETRAGSVVPDSGDLLDLTGSGETFP